MKRILGIVLAGFALVAALAAGATIWLNNIWLPEQTFAILGEPVLLAKSPALRFFPLRIDIGAFSWQKNVDGLRIYFTTADAHVIPDISALLKGEDAFLQVELTRPDLRVTPAPLQAAALKPGHGDSLSRELTAIHSVIITDGSFHFQPSTTLLAGQNWQLTLLDLRPRQEMRLQGAGDLELSGLTFPSLQGHLSLATPLRYYAPNFTFQGALANFAITSPGLWDMFSPLELRCDGALNGQNGAIRLGSATVASPLVKGDVSGEITPGQFQGHVRLDLGHAPWQLDGDLRVNDQNLKLSNATFVHGSLNAMGEGQVNFAGQGELAQLTLQWAEGEIASNLKWDGKSFTLDTSGQDIQLGDVLSQFGVPGLGGCPAKFAAQLHFAGADALAMRRSVRGHGRLRCQNLTLEPFGELSLLLPLLGLGQKVPDVVDDVQADFTARDGIISISPVKAQGRGISLDGQAKIDLPADAVNGQGQIRLLGLNIPVSFSGSLDKVDFRINAP